MTAFCGIDERVNFFVKAADKLSALIKCTEELNMGNREFSSARVTIEKSLKEYQMPEVDCFLKHCISSFTKNIDEVTL